MTLARVDNKDATTTDYSFGVETAKTTSKVLFNISDTNVDIWADGVKGASSAKDFAWAGNNPSVAGTGQAVWIHEMTMWREAVTDAEATILTQ